MLTVNMSSSVRTASRILAGLFAFVLYAGARGIRQNLAAFGEEMLVEAALYVLAAHLAAAAAVYFVFFRYSGTRVANRIELANAEFRIERSLPGAGDRLAREEVQLRTQYLRLTVASGMLVLLLLVSLLAGGTFFGAEAATVVMRRFSAIDIAYYSILAVLIPGLGYAIFRRVPPALWGADVLAFVYSMAFPLGAALACYTWWVTRSIREADAIRRVGLQIPIAVRAI